MAINRNDPASLSFGRRVNNLEALTQAQAKQIEQLTKGQLSSEEKLSAKELAAAKREERQRANQMLASYDTTLDDLDSLNQSLLSRSRREQIRHNKNGLHASQMSGAAVRFDDAALSRLDNWKQMSASRPAQQSFTANNVLPWDAKPQRPYDIWKSRQDGPQGKFERH